MQVTTHINPGAFKKYKQKSILKIVKKQILLLLSFKLRIFKNSLIVDSLNWYNFSFTSNRGTNLKCPICDYQGKSFVHFCNNLGISWNSACPNCDSRSRHRGLSIMYKTFLEEKFNKMNKEIKVMHFAPEPILFDTIQQSFVNYKTSDFFLEDVDFPKEDIQKLSFENNSFDVILCNHVIEHVPDDLSALKEIQRVLSFNGNLLLTIPGNYKRKKTIFFKELTNNGHYRDYGWDIVAKLNEIFSKVEPIDLFRFNDAEVSYGIRKNDYVFISTK